MGTRNDNVGGCYVGVSGGTVWFFCYANTTFTSSINVDTNVKHTVEWTSNGQLKFDDTILKTSSSTTWAGTHTMLINARHNADGTIPSTSNSNKYYSLKIWDNDILIRDFIPVKLKSTNQPGLYDFVTGRFFVNAGTGEFTAGPNI